MTKRLLVVVLILTAVLGGIFGWKSVANQRSMVKMSQPPSPAVVATEYVTNGTWQPSLFAIGSIVPTRGVIVSTEVPGIVEEIFFDSGQFVEKGAILLRLDDEVDRSELVALEADRKLAELTRDRAQRLVNDKLGSRSNFDEAQAALDGALARAATKRATIRQKTLRAPFAGELGIREVNRGRYIGAGAEIVSLVALDPIFAEFNLPERQLGNIETGRKVLVGVQAYSDQDFEGEIVAISPTIDMTTRNVRVRALLANPDRRLRPGMFAEVRTLLPLRENVLTLPERALTFSPYGNSVFVVVAESGNRAVSRRQVKTGEVRTGRIEIVSGLAEGDEVVSAGQNKLRNGQAVTVDNSVELKGLASSGR